MNDPAETLVTESLESHAGSAPSDALLLSTVHRRLRRRRRARTAGGVVLACAAVAVVGVGLRSLVQPAGSEPAPVAQPPAGWHWESYANLEVQVPDGWKEIGSSVRTTCPAEKPPWDGWVGRPSMLPGPALGCPVPVAGTRPVLPPAYRVPYVRFTFDASRGVTQYEDGWTKEVRSFGPLQVEVFGTDPAVRARVFDSARTINGVDSNGCAPTRTIGDANRPSGKGLAAIGTVDSIAVCAYNSTPSPRIPPLVASAELTGDQARAVGVALRTAPEPGPRPTKASGDVKANLHQCQDFGDREVLVLRVHGDRGTQEVVVRLSGCGPFDTDDGKTFRDLTKESVGPLVDAVGRPERRSPFLTNLLK